MGLSLDEAVRILKQDLRKIGKRNSRIHDNTVENSVQRLRAIETGICRNCTHFMVEAFHRDSRERVRLRCSEGFSPLELYRKTDFGEEAKCPGFSGRAA